ncbi:hypothetical protein AKJ36_03460 [candidate division MSBL1 archaeon SCGC-AAA259I07]|uniref:HTH marR-type domain-containing protein n=1 Tax=candidate division MSBL1 archaeon SCGC-AAA259I07 TaxID=1698266 RepID=A0A133UIQ0_9EURY|nr:hypothetical protein AKJ36_03460 [candidate division MSBL1 archaeon SCGC-AAA259I07]
MYKQKNRTLDQPDQPRSFRRDVLDWMDCGSGYPVEDLADEFGVSDHKAKGILEELYEQGSVDKKPDPEKEESIYMKRKEVA